MLNIFRVGSSRAYVSPRVPDGLRVYAIGDIHGRADLLAEVFERIDADLANNGGREAIHVFLGDYIDRGPSSRHVLDLLIKRSHAHRSTFLRGNHEGYMASFLTKPAILGEWRQLGGLETLMSYGVMPSFSDGAAAQSKLAATFSDAVPGGHRRFLDALQLSFTCGDYFFAHAGIRPGVPLAKQREEDLLWIRDEFLISEERHEKLIVHGHTPVAQPDIRSNRINIDTGAYATGQLTCLVLEADHISFV